MVTVGRVLIVEDDADVARAARVALLPHVARAEIAESATAVEGMVEAGTLDAVLLDMNFRVGERSGGEGLEAIARILAIDPSLAVVSMTAFGGVSLAVESLKRGAVDFILKPWRNEKLVEAILSAVKSTQARREQESCQLDELERGAIARALARHSGNVSSAATALGISRPALYRRMARHGLTHEPK